MTIGRTSAIALTLLLAGCGFFRRPPNTFYTLETIAPEGAQSSIGGVPIGIEAVELPPGLDRRGIVVRQSDQRVNVRGTNQWTDSLETMVLHTLAFNLANRLPEGMVILPGQAKPDTPMRSIYIVFEELAPGPDPTLVLDARWVVRAIGSPDLTHHERFEVPLQSLESANIATGMNRALATFADHIVVRLDGTQR